MMLTVEKKITGGFPGKFPSGHNDFLSNWCYMWCSSEELSAVAVEGDTGSEEDVEIGSEEDVQSGGVEEADYLSMSTTSTAYTLIETAHPVFDKVKRLWNSPMESHREV